MQCVHHRWRSLLPAGGPFFSRSYYNTAKMTSAQTPKDDNSFVQESTKILSALQSIAPHSAR